MLKGSLLDMSERTFIQGLLALIVVVTVCVMAILGRTVPPWLTQTLFVVLGFWFGSVTQNGINMLRHGDTKYIRRTGNAGTIQTDS